MVIIRRNPDGSIASTEGMPQQSHSSITNKGRYASITRRFTDQCHQ